jgi:hypothetical protein
VVTGSIREVITDEETEERNERAETTSSEADSDDSYARPDFETLGSIAAIGELMRQS